MTHRARKKVAAALAGLLISGGAAYATCGGTEAMVIGEVQSLVESIIQNLVSGGAALIQQMVTQGNETMSALKVVVKQEAASSEKKIVGMRSASEAFSASYVAARTSQQIQGIYNTYQSQGFDPCGVSTEVQAMRAQEVQADKLAATKVVQEIDSAPGRLGNPVAAEAARVAQHRQLFCTQAEANAGICSNVGPLAGADSNAAIMFQDSAPGDDTTAAKDAFVNNVFGLPTSTSTYAGRGNSPEAQAAMYDRHRRDALNSIAMFSLKSIEADHEKDAAGKSLATRLRERVEEYFGSPTSANWAKSLAVQEEHGILIDMMKIEGIDLKLAQRRIKQNMRIEANLAALLAVANETNNGK
jgi:hypothetical protein